MELCVQNPNGMSQKFPQFDTVTDASDHHYSLQLLVKQCKKHCYKHSILQKNYERMEISSKKNLPPSIYVRIYENKLNSSSTRCHCWSYWNGTPYHDGLFFFDFYFPAEYPNKPPLAHYTSYGLCINPNLYSSGYVCLSILNTWEGPSWQPNESTVLQVLVSIQGLVLNEQPFYNDIEPMFSEGRFDKMWMSYGYNAFALSCKTMIYHVLRKPLKYFEDLVVEHFRDGGRSILTACKAYMNGYVRVNEYEDGELSLPDQKVKLNQLVEKIEKEHKGKAKISEKKSISWFSS
ncbi:putative ubiquitin-conjugating enzyme E2 23 [Heracleum sosnowskyi]|uniref:Ubiquitin-conjugating enzyme E2 23 n=1 Tax=Heracleum sosnowskyi TaxID=360622 RepID=A0AAD8I9C8_9APIA|nr:putative ubiquitin-conjugating enzyme E2 23 [Heracleum sosnowskyi]